MGLDHRFFFCLPPSWAKDPSERPVIANDEEQTGGGVVTIYAHHQQDGMVDLRADIFSRTYLLAFWMEPQF